MHSQHSAQDVLLCGFCKTAPVQSHCELCHINLCKACVGEHLSDSSKRHNVVPYTHRKSTLLYQNCPDHADKHCELYCDICDVPVCSSCVSDKHEGHKLSDVMKKLNSKTEDLQNDLEELETRIYPRYEKIISDVQTERAKLETGYGELTTAVAQQGEVWHTEITAIVNQRKSDIKDMKNKHLEDLTKHTDEITRNITELKKIIQDLKTILESNDVSLTATYTSRNDEFRKPPPKIQITLPSLFPQKIKKDHLNQLFGSALSITTEDGYIMQTPEAASSLPVELPFDEPQLTATIHTGFRSSVACRSDEEIWTCGSDKFMKLHNLQGKLLVSIQTKSRKQPGDIAVTRDGDLVYSDPKTRTVNVVKDKQIQTMLRLQGWTPHYVCSTSSNDLLVTMINDDKTQSKVVRYSDSTETQTIQFDDHGCPLYSSDVYKYISENRNLDICVADFMAKAVVVVNQSGKLRFRYTGHPSYTKKSFEPFGITTDSQSQILTADYYNGYIDILDQDGQFLRFIDNCDLRDPHGLCVDTRDNLFVAERWSGKVKKIQYR
ncbi:uncharacterized protein LOC125648272 [Ostrea edulis]|uniref:uncharacterized protein LOC125648272 n=1 Tax=Ostrea edulis TaxID=37623 RepID=UPI0024AFBDB1|nr:uncharacterized protein LOC125648272 [Ostrea edulis]